MCRQRGQSPSGGIVFFSDSTTMAPTSPWEVNKMRVRQWLEEPGLTLIRGWARAGVSPRTIAGRMGVGLRTLERWRRKYPVLALALSGTKEVVDSQVEDALLQKALGYESVERKVEVSAKGERKEVSTVKQVGPDVSAISLWLKKRRPEQWGDGESVQALPESNLLTLLSWERGELDGISELQPAAEADHDLVEPQGVPGTGRSDL